MWWFAFGLLGGYLLGILGMILGILFGLWLDSKVQQ
jgi:hypothetical protein